MNYGVGSSSLYGVLQKRFGHGRSVLNLLCEGHPLYALHFHSKLYDEIHIFQHDEFCHLSFQAEVEPSHPFPALNPKILLRQKSRKSRSFWKVLSLKSFILDTIFS